MNRNMKNKLIFFLILTFLTSPGYAEHKSLTKYGLFFNTKREHRYFYSHKLEAKWTILLTNPANLFSLDQVRMHSKCNIKSKYIERTREQINSEINKIWTNELSDMLNYTNPESKTMGRKKRFLGLALFGLAALISGYISYHNTGHVTPKTIELIRGDITNISKNQAQMGSIINLNHQELKEYSNLICDYYSENLNAKVEHYISAYIYHDSKTYYLH